MLFCFGFPNIKTQFEPPIIISLIFKKVIGDETSGYWFGFPYLFRDTTRFSLMSLNSLVELGLPLTLFTLALPWPYMTHQLVEMTTQPLDG